MKRFQQMREDKKSLCRVELHNHLDSSIRFETLWELLKKKDVELPGTGSLQHLKDAIMVKTPQSLKHFLQGLQIVQPALAGDLDAIERIAYEHVENMHRNRVIYAEARFPPHKLLDPSKPNLTTRDVVKAVLRGIRKGESQFSGTKVRVILMCVRAFPEHHDEVVELCDEFRNDGVVGMDIAGVFVADVDENGNPILDSREIAAFEKAKSKGIHRTCHAGEDGPASLVKACILTLHAERIGHGYFAVADDDIYNLCKERGIHMEACPSSSLATRAVPLDAEHHPILRYCEDRVSFSINTDDSLVTDSFLDEEYSLLRSWGMREADFAFCNFSAANHAFLPEDEKQELLKKLRLAYGVL